LHQDSDPPFSLYSWVMVCLNLEAEVIALGSHAASDIPGAGSKDAIPSALPKSQDIIQSLGALHALFAGAPNDLQERPRKRRRIDINTDSDGQPAYLPEDRSVVLAKVSINLVMIHIRHRVFSFDLTAIESRSDTVPAAISVTCIADRKASRCMSDQLFRSRPWPSSIHSVRCTYRHERRHPRHHRRFRSSGYRATH
jgi:hypothetical protein